MSPPMSATEAERLRTLHDFAVLDTQPEERFDRLTTLAAALFNAPIALVSLIDQDRQWFKSRLGLDATETPRAWAFCDHAIKAGPNTTLVVEDATVDPRFADNPLVTGEPGIRFYAGATLTTASGSNVGTLCVIDKAPRDRPLQEDLNRLSVLARMVVDELELSRATKAVSEQKRLLELAEAMSGVGHWRYEIASGKIDWSDEVYRIHGVERGQFEPSPEAGLAFFLPEDLAQVSDLVERALAHGESYAFQLRLKRPDGEIRHVGCKASCELDGSGVTSAVVGVFQDVTEQVTRLAAIARSETRYRLLAENANDTVTEIDLSGRFLYVSPAVTAMTGYTPDEVIGRRSLDFIYADDILRVQEAFLRALDGQDTWRIEYRLVHKSGETIWVEARPSLARDPATGEVVGVTDVIRDITDRKAADAAVAASEARYRLLADNATDMVIRFRPGGAVTFVTPASQKILGFEPDELIGRRALEWAHPDDLETLRLYMRALRKTDGVMPDPYQFRARHKDGHWVWLEGHPRMYFDPLTGEAVETQDAMRDVTKRKALEFELERARADAEAAAAHKSEFLARMSHELRTPLNGVIGFTDVLAQSPLDPDQRLYVDRILSAGRSLLGVINDILDFSKIEAGQLAVEQRPYDLKTVIEEVVDLVEAANPDLQVALLHSWALEVEDAYLGDEHRVRQIVTNIVGNAVKFTREGAVTVTADIEDDQLRIVVTDTGPGIPADMLDMVFDGFAQADSSVARQYGGTGLGLTISRSLARLMGGELTLRSEVGVGTRVTLWLPNSPCLAQVASASDDEPVAAPTAHAGLRVMVVDDVEMNRELVEIALGQGGHQVETFASARAAIAALEGGAGFDLILMDVQMPEMDGLTATRHIRTLPSPIRDIPIFALTASVLAEQATECRAAGMDDHVAKPIDMKALLARLDRIKAERDAPQIDAPQIDAPKAETPEAEAPAPEEPKPDPIAALRQRYVQYLGDLPRELVALMSSPDLAERSKGVAALAHAVAGTSGSFGFRQISDAAFRLEAIAKRIAAEEASDEGLLPAVEAFVTELPRSLAA
jgi:PAS domain S-box-containing protein